MAYFSEFPTTRTYDGDLGWLIQTIKKLISAVDDVNQITYADPINWNIATQYRSYTIVRDANSGALYISKQAVPANVPLTNDEYWIPIGNFDYQISFLKEAITASDEGNAIYFQNDHSENDLVWYNEKLYKLLKDVTIGETIDTNTNISEIDISTDLHERFNKSLPAHHFVDENEYRNWMNIYSQEEFVDFINRFNNGFTSQHCRLMTPGTYKLPNQESGLYPIANGIQLHIYNESGGEITLDLNGVTIYTSHINIVGYANARIKIIDTNESAYSASRPAYAEGGTSYFSYCDFYCSFSVYSGWAIFTECSVYDYTDVIHRWLYIAGGARVFFQSPVYFYIDFKETNDAVIAMGNQSYIKFQQRINIKRPSTPGMGFFITIINSNARPIIEIAGSSYDIDNSTSYRPSNLGDYQRTLNSNNFGFTLVAATQTAIDQFYSIGQELASPLYVITNIYGG